MASEWVDVDYNPPVQIGWYATLEWGEEEGCTVSAAYWNGKNWSSHTTDNRSPEPFVDRDTAMVWACAHDPEGSWEWTPPKSPYRLTVTGPSGVLYWQELDRILQDGDTLILGPITITMN